MRYPELSSTRFKKFCGASKRDKTCRRFEALRTWFAFMWATPTFAGEPGIQRAHQRIPQWSVQDAGETFVIRSYPNLNGTTPLLSDQCPGIVLANHIVAWLAGFS